MEIIKKFQIRKIKEPVTRVKFSERIVDYWYPAPKKSDPKIEHIIVAHDGQNIFDPKSATRRQTWKLAESASNLFWELGLPPPLIIGVFHSGNSENEWGRSHDLVPQSPFQSGLVVSQEKYREVKLEDLRADYYLESIVNDIVPSICENVGVDIVSSKKALLGSSLGGLAALYGMGKYPNYFDAALAFSPHWVIGEEPLVMEILSQLPKPGANKIWMSRGTKGLDNQYQPFQDSADTRLISLGWTLERDFKSQVFAGDRHSESSWRKRVKGSLKFWLENSTI